MSGRIAGKLELKVGGVTQWARGTFKVNLGPEQRETVVGSDGAVHGYIAKGGEPAIEGEITDRGDLDVAALFAMDGETVTLRAGNGKLYRLREAWFNGEGEINVDEAIIPVKFGGKSCEEVA